MKANILKLVALGAMALPLNGCLISRTVSNVSDHVDKPYTMLETNDRYFPGRWKVHHRFWQCKDAGDTLECQPVCDFDNEEYCPWWSKE